MTAITLPRGGPHRPRPHIQARAAEPGLTGPEAISQASQPPPPPSTATTPPAGRSDPETAP